MRTIRFYFCWLLATVFALPAVAVICVALTLLIILGTPFAVWLGLAEMRRHQIK
jgi:hypothetical protein